MFHQNQLTVELAHLFDQSPQTHPVPDGKGEINVQVADGWAITGHYHNNTLQAVTLRKTSPTESK